MSFRRVRAEEEGLAMITAILVAAIVLVLAVSSIDIAIHNSTASGYDRNRLESINAAEAGIGYYYSQLSSTATASLPCSVTKTLTTTPAGSFTVTPAFYDANLTAMTCPPASTPSYVLLHSVGVPSGLSAPKRTMESYVKLTPKGSGAFPSTALYGASSVDMRSNIQVFGSGSNNADVYSAGDYSAQSNSTLYGSLYVQGTATLRSGMEVKGNLWASGAVTLSGNAKVRGSVISSTSTITLSGASHVYTDAKAGGAITAPSGSIDGVISPNTSGIPSPPAYTYPTFTFVPSDWTNAGYTQQNFSGASACTSAATAITNWTSGSLLLQLTGMGATPCTLFPPSKVLPGNLSILTEGPVTLNTGTNLTAGSGSPFNVFFFTGLTAHPGYCDFTTRSNSNVGAGLSALIYTPSTCSVMLSSNSSISAGQIFSGTVSFRANTSLAYSPVTIPGTVTPGFLEDVLYTREIQ